VKKILVIRGDGKFSELLRGAGFDVTDLELIGTRQVDDLTELRSKFQQLSDYDGLFFTSPVAAEIFVRERNRTNGFHGKVYVLGDRAKTVLEHAGLNVVHKPPANTAQELLASLKVSEFENKKFLFVSGNKSTRAIPEYLARYAAVDEVVVYETFNLPVAYGTIAEVAERLRKHEVDWICFFSPSGVERFVDLFSAIEVLTATIGTTTATKARELGLKVDLVSPRSDAEVFAKSLIGHIKEQ